MTQKQNQIYLIPERECGGCAACCISLTINTDELVKLPNTPCSNLRAKGGCKVYENWPDVCDKYFCAWRFLPVLSAKWRPDLCGIMLEFSQENFPGPFAGRVGIKFIIMDENKALSYMPFYTFLIEQIKKGIPCLISYGTNPAELPAIAFLNIALHQAVNSNDPGQVKKAIEKAIEACQKQPVEKLKLVDGNLVQETSL